MSLMPSAPVPSNEDERLETLRLYNILDTVPEKAFDDLTWLASRVCKTPIALMSIIDRDRQWFKSKSGLNVPETPREIAFCAHAILQPEPLVIPDATLDRRFAENPLVTDSPNIRFYAGARITTANGYALGTVCVIDREPRHLHPDDVSALEMLARQAGALLELRRLGIRLTQMNTDLRLEARQSDNRLQAMNI